MKKIIDIAPFGSLITAEEKKTIREQSKTKPPTHRDVLLKTWAQDTEAMARVTVWEKYNILSRTFVFSDFATQSFHEAVAHMIAHLNSAAEVGK